MESKSAVNSEADAKVFIQVLDTIKPGIVKTGIVTHD